MITLDHVVEHAAGRMAAAGFSSSAARSRSELLARCAASLRQAGVAGGRQAIALFVPGRIEVLGKHTDYAGGRSLLAAVDRGFCVVAAPRPDSALRMRAVDLGQDAEMALHADLAPAAGHWTNYPMTVARRIARNFAGVLCGADVAFLSDLPPAAGLSSSSALVVATFMVLARTNDLPRHPAFAANIATKEDLGGYLGTVENGQSFGTLAGDKGVGTFGGSEDHIAILCGRPGQLVQYRFCPVRFEQSIPMPPRCVFVIGSSGVVAEKTGAAMARYNRTSQRVAALVEIWRAHHPGAGGSLADILAGDGAADELRGMARQGAGGFAPGELLDRLAHFIEESQQIIPAAAEALRRGDLDAFGRLVDRSQRGAEERLGTQIPETIFLAQSARDLGAVAASAFGAGFGGSAWAIVHEAEATAFCQRWQARYRAAFAPAGPAAFFITPAGPPAADLA